MKRVVKNIILLIVIIVLSSCGKKSYVIFDYNCNGQELHKCELKNNRLDCFMQQPTCGEYKFLGWYRANDYDNKVDMNSTFKANEVIYARWEENGQVIESSSQEQVSTITPPDVIDQPSSSQIEYSSKKDEPSSQKPTPTPEATYTILFNANGGSGGQSSQISGVKYGSNLPTINQTKPTKTGYTFTGWYDSQTGGTQYYNSSNSPVRKYDKKNNITLYAQWRINVLTIQYNGNGGTWISTNSNYGVNSSGTVIVKSTGQVFSQKVNYGTNTESSGLTDYNGSWFKWKKDGYIVESKKEYYLQNGSIKNTLDQTKVYSAADLAKYSGCDLSKSDCTIMVKVNWTQSKFSISSVKLEDVVVNVTVNEGSNKIAAYYFSSIQKTPDKNGYDWISVSKSTFKTVKFPGTYYLYIKDNKGNIVGGNKVVVPEMFDVTFMREGKKLMPKTFERYLGENGSTVKQFNKELSTYNVKHGLRTRESVVVAAMAFISRVQEWGYYLPYAGANSIGNDAISKDYWGVYKGWGGGDKKFLACDPYVVWSYKNAGLNIYANRSMMRRYCKEKQVNPNGTTQEYKAYDGSSMDYPKEIRIFYFFVGIVGSTNEIGDNIKPVHEGLPGDVLQNGAGSGHEMLLVDRYDDNKDGISDGYIVLQSRNIGLCYEKRPYSDVILYDMTKVFNNTANFADHLYGWQDYIIPESDYPDYLKELLNK